MKSNPRLSSTEAERVRGCVFAERFVTEDRVTENAGTVTGSVTIAQGATFDGASHIDFDARPLPTGPLSIVMQFRASATSVGVLAGNDSAGSGWRISVTEDGVVATVSDGTYDATAAVPVAYADGKLHTVTATVTVGGTLTCYVDDVDAVEDMATGYTGGTPGDLSVGDGLIGTVETLVVFEGTLTAGDHEWYWAPRQPPTYEYIVGPRTCGGGLLREQHTVAHDLMLGDGSPSSAPTYDTTLQCLTFDGVDDLLTDWPDIPDTLTVMAVLDSGPGPYVYLATASGLIEDLGTAGDFEGDLYRLSIWDRELPLIEQLDIEARWSQHLADGELLGIEARLVREGQCVLNHRYDNGNAVDHSGDGNGGVATDVTWDGDLGATMTGATSVITVSDDTTLHCDPVTILVSGIFTANRELVVRGANYALTVSAVSETSMTVNFGGQSIVCPRERATEQVIAVVAEDGDAQLYIDGVFIDSFGSVTLTESATADVEIGGAP